MHLRVPLPLPLSLCLALGLGSTLAPAFVTPAFAAPAVAADADQTSVLVSTLQPGSPESSGFAALVENFLAQELDGNRDIDVMRVEDTPKFEDYSARIYMEGCPPGDVVGCTQVVGERGAARFAITGTVQSLDGRTQVEIVILDIEGSREVIRFQSELGNGSDEAFAKGVARVLVAAINGEIGQEKDIRDLGGEPVDPMANDAVAAQLAQLTRELGTFKVELRRSDREVERPTYTLDDLAARMEGEGAKPWERIGMSPGTYMRYKNSGMPLFEWRTRAMGRAGQLLVDGTVGFATGPYNGTYYGRYAYDTTLNVVDAYSTQAVQDGGGFVFGGGAAYGLTSSIQVGAGVSVATGAYTVDIGQQTEGQPVSIADPAISTHTTLSFGPAVAVTLFPVLPYHPTFGGGIQIVRGRTRVDPEQVPPSLTTFAPATLVSAELFVGGEVRISRTVDFFLRLPLQVRLAGSTLEADRVGTQEVVSALVPGTAGVVGGGVQAGIQMRFLGKKAQDTSRYDEMDEAEEPEE